ncbi:MAG: hypothetical protein HC778_00085 [Chamaesiphon sp. CSU_1_12]|nr:hypothetical protein [Chamaesiphon sp. CSU_1_12]
MHKKIDWQTCTNLPTRCYRNLNNGLMSLQQKIGKSWLVVGHTDYLIIESLSFYVSEASRQRVIERQRKSVHAWALGILKPFHNKIDLSKYQEVYYCPFKQQHFTFKGSDRKLDRAEILVVVKNKVFCPGETNDRQLKLFC